MSSSPGIEAIAERSELVRAALETAREAHAGQIRNGSGGMPYIDHPVAVAEAARRARLPRRGAGGGPAARRGRGERHRGRRDPRPLRRAGRRPGRGATDAEEIQPYEQRKDAHRAGVEKAGPDALAIYAADKLANIRALRRVYASEGEAVGDESKAPLDVKITVWEADLDMLAREAPDLPFLGELAAQLAGLRADRAAAAQAPAP